MNYITTTMSLEMLAVGRGPLMVEFESINIQDVRDNLDSIGLVNVPHRGLLAIFSEELGRELESENAHINVGPDNIIYVGRYRGPRLEGGETRLPRGAHIDWYRATVKLP